ncbi:MAG: hypothetical protein HOV94_20200, partial [Saccharothrix sp.]|nr:hypothetical protein [Saccharothrix sp.]
MRRRRSGLPVVVLLTGLALTACAEAPKFAPLPGPTGPPALTGAPVPAGVSTTLPAAAHLV